MREVSEAIKNLIGVHFILTKNKAMEYRPPVDIKVVGKDSRKIFKLLKKYALEIQDTDVVVTRHMDGERGNLGHWVEEESLIELREGRPRSEKLLTLCHETGHMLLYNSRYREKTNEILAESFACILLGVLGMSVRDYSYFNQYKDRVKIMGRYEDEINSAVMEFMEWVMEK